MGSSLCRARGLLGDKEVSRQPAKCCGRAGARRGGSFAADAAGRRSGADCRRPSRAGGPATPTEAEFAEVAAEMFAAVTLMVIWRCDVMRRGSCYRKIRAPLVTIQDYARVGGE